MRVELIENRSAKTFLDAHHPLKTGHSFLLALGVLWRDALGGVITIGNPISNLAVRVFGIDIRESLELRKMYLLDHLPKNSESRALAVASRLVFRAYPPIRMLLTYCAGDEAASAYKATGWIPCEAKEYVRDVLVDGQWMTVRDANRKRLMDRATETRIECRRKWVLPRDEETRRLVLSAIEPKREKC